MMRRRCSPALRYAMHARQCRYAAGYFLERAEIGRAHWQALRNWRSRRECEASAEYWLNLCWLWRERLREYLEAR